MKKPSISHSMRKTTGLLVMALALLLPWTRGPAQQIRLPDLGSSPAEPDSAAADSKARQIRLPDFGSSADLVISSAQERRLGREFMKNVRRALPIIEDPLLTDYLEGLGNRLIAASATGAGTFNFFFVANPAINAFAGPDGHIGIFSGLMLTSENESELAAVVAHEIAHVTQRHLLRALEDRKRSSIPATAAIIAAGVLGAQVAPDLGIAAAAGVQAAAVQRQINFTRENEKEADRIGITTLAAAGFDPYAMAGLFERLAKASRTHEINAPEFLRTHPVTTNRIADALGRADRHGHQQRADDLSFHLARARLRERAFDSAQKTIAHFKRRLKDKRYRNESATRYGHALGLARGNRIGAAHALVDQLIARHPNQAEFIILQARLDTAQGNRKRAIETLQTTVESRPTNIPLCIAYADTLMAAGQPARAFETLKDMARRRPGKPLIYQKLSDAALKSGQKGETHRYRAEKLYAEGDLEPAIRQLEIALRQPGLSYHDASGIQVRLDALRQEEKDTAERR